MGVRSSRLWRRIFVRFSTRVFVDALRVTCLTAAFILGGNGFVAALETGLKILRLTEAELRLRAGVGPFHLEVQNARGRVRPFFPISRIARCARVRSAAEDVTAGAKLLAGAVADVVPASEAIRAACLRPIR